MISALPAPDSPGLGFLLPWETNRHHEESACQFGAGLAVAVGFS